MGTDDRMWVTEAMRRIDADLNRSADTHLLSFPLPESWGIDLYLKDESVHPTGSLKHRLARSLFMYALCNGWITEGTTVVEASSGSTAVSEAYFARLLGVPFIAVMPSSTSVEKVNQIKLQGGRCHLVDDPATVTAESERLAADCGGHFMDQFTYAERATDWRGNNNIAESIFSQLALERHPEPTWVVVGAGTGGTSATIGRWVRYQGLGTRVCLVDPERSAYATGWQTGDRSVTVNSSSRIEGIGRPRMEPSFVGSVIDRVIPVPDVASFATLRIVAERLGRRPGSSTGTNVHGALQIVSEMKAAGQHGSVVTLMCDLGDRYTATAYDDRWLAAEDFDIAPWIAHLQQFLDGGEWLPPSVSSVEGDEARLGR